MKNKRSKGLFKKLFTTKPGSSCCNIKIEEVGDEVENKTGDSTEISKKVELSKEDSNKTNIIYK